MRIVIRLHLGSMKYSSAINLPSPFKGGFGNLSLVDIPTPWVLATFFLLLSLYLLFAPGQRGSSSLSSSSGSSVLPFHSTKPFNAFPSPPASPTTLKAHTYSPPDSPTRHKGRRPYGATHGRRWSTGKDLVREMEELSECAEELMMGDVAPVVNEKIGWPVNESTTSNIPGTISPRRRSEGDQEC